MFESPHQKPLTLCVMWPVLNWIGCTRSRTNRASTTLLVLQSGMLKRSSSATWCAVPHPNPRMFGTYKSRLLNAGGALLEFPEFDALLKKAELFIVTSHVRRSLKRNDESTARRLNNFIPLVN